jgi:hypothetical protein
VLLEPESTAPQFFRVSFDDKRRGQLRVAGFVCEDAEMTLPKELVVVEGLTLDLLGIHQRDAYVEIVCELRDDENFARCSAAYAVATREWEERATGAIRSHGDASGPREARPAFPAPPAQPADVFAQLELEVDDDVGTTYRWRGSALGGTGSERSASWTFTPAAPPSAQHFDVRVKTR